MKKESLDKKNQAIKKFLNESIDEMDRYIEDEDNGFDDLERHDCQIALEAYERVLDYVENI